MSDTIYIDEELEGFTVFVFTGEQWEAVCKPTSKLEAEALANTLHVWLKRELRLSVNSTLDEALNTGDGVYRP